jgi:vancomycin resistance protein VanJ
MTASRLALLFRLYFGILALCLGLRALFEDHWWWLGSLNSLTPYWFAPLLIVAPASFLAKQRWAQGLSLASFVVFLVLFGSLFMSKEDPPAKGPQLVVMTYNLLGTNENWPNIRAAIVASQADIVAFQELNRETAALIERELLDDYPYQHLETQEGMISRYPTMLEAITLPGNWSTPPQVYQIDFDGQPVTLVNAHFFASVLNPNVFFMDWVFRERERQAAIVAEFAVAAASPVIVTCDFNATDQSRAYRLITADLADSWREAGTGWGHTFPGGPSPGLWRPTLAGQTFPKWLVRIDYIFYSAEWRAVRAHLGEWDGVSDHRPVIAVLELQR